MSLFPIFLKLTGRPCLVIGAGELAESKIESLLAAQAHVTVIATVANARIRGLADAGEITLHTRPFAAGDVSRSGPAYFLAVAATDDAAVNRAVFAEAEQAGLLMNAVDDPPFCDFYFPSVVRRGELQIAVSTAGHSPALAQRLRKEINAILPLDAGDWLAELGNLRREVLQLEPLNQARKEILHTLAQRDVCAYDACPSRTLARRHAETNPRASSLLTASAAEPARENSAAEARPRDRLELVSADPSFKPAGV